MGLSSIITSQRPVRSFLPCYKNGAEPKRSAPIILQLLSTEFRQFSCYTFSPPVHTGLAGHVAAREAVDIDLFHLRASRQDFFALVVLNRTRKDIKAGELSGQHL